MSKETQATKKTDAEILFPDEDIKIGDEVITVREFTFAESLKAVRLAQPIIRGLAAPLTELDEDNLSYNDIDIVFAEHADNFMQLLAMTTGKDPEWIAQLPEADGQLLAMTFWSINSGFFTRRITQQLIGAAMQSNKETTSASSSTH